MQEPLVWVVSSDAEISILDEPVHLALLPPPCMFRQFAIDGLEQTNRKWEVLFTGTSTANIHAAVQAGMGLSVLPKGALGPGIQVAPAKLNLPQLPIYSIVLITDESTESSAKDVFIRYLEAEMKNLM